MWEVEAAAFYLDLKLSSITKELLKSKVTELTGVCERLDGESATKSLVIEEIIERIRLLENEVGGLKRKLSAYTPVITSLKEDFASLEYIYFLWTNKTFAVSSREHKDVVIETYHQENSYLSSKENKSTLIPDGVANLLNGPHAHNAWRTKSQKRSLMKDIPLDHKSNDPDYNKYFKRDHSMNVEHKLHSYETDQHDVTEENKQGYATIEDIITCHRSNNSRRYPNPNYSSELEAEKELGIDKLELSKTRKKTSKDGKRKILERLSSDAQRLAILQMTLQDLKKKRETKK
ncbi:hypothetical protein RJT34_16715 [Clitoria ternatea]|uniref:Uncharacterized protein n=1 Tax=Clitoria ternatea TaxID=43366 RepID=A0AAN9PDX1_CLITE